MKLLITPLLVMFAAVAVAQTVVTPVNIGTTPNDGTGDPLRTAFTKLNSSDANLNAGKMENTNPSFTGTLTGDIAAVGTGNFGSGGVSVTGGGVINPGSGGFNIGGAGTMIGLSHIVSGPTHTWKTIEVTPGAAGGATGVPSMFVIHGTLNISNMVDASLYEFMHLDGSFNLDRPGASNTFNGTFTGAFTSLTNGGYIFNSDGSGSAADGHITWDTAGNVATAGSISAGTIISVAGGSSSLSALTLTLGGATIAQQTQSATSPSRAWRQVNLGFSVSASGPTNNFYKFDAETLFKGAGDYAGYEFLHQDGSVSFDKAGTTNSFGGTFTGTGSFSKISSTISHVVGAIGNASSIGSSPASWTNNATFAMEIYLTQSSAYSVAKNGAGIYASLAGNSYLVLQPGSYVTITFTGSGPVVSTNAW